MRELLAPLAMPVHPLMGNHDDREALRAAFSDHPGVAAAGEFVQYTAQCGPVTVIVCDTHVPELGTAGGSGPERLGWIEAELERAAGSPTVLALHHPPILTGIHEFDTEIPLALEDREALARSPDQPDLIVCRPHPPADPRHARSDAGLRLPERAPPGRVRPDARTPRSGWSTTRPATRCTSTAPIPA